MCLLVAPAPTFTQTVQPLERTTSGQDDEKFPWRGRERESGLDSRWNPGGNSNDAQIWCVKSEFRWPQNLVADLLPPVTNSDGGSSGDQSADIQHSIQRDKCRLSIDEGTFADVQTGVKYFN